MRIEWIASPNFSTGRRGFRPEAVVVHIMEGTLAGTDAWFQNPASQVSAHYGIGQSGTVHQYVDEENTAWHAGRRHNASWELIKIGVNPNLYTIGIEHEGREDDDWSEQMYGASAELIKGICNRWSIPIDRQHVIGHREIYSRKTCPGHRVDLERLVALARQHASAVDGYNAVPVQGSTTARRSLRIREGAPNTAARVVRVAPQKSSLEYVGWTSNGQNVNGNAHWYRDADGNYFWAGGTTSPVPGLE